MPTWNAFAPKPDATIMADFLAAAERALTSFCALIGRLVSWLTLALVLLTAAVVVLRYGFQFGRIYLQEIITYLHALIFMLAAAWTLRLDGHVRVDVWYRTRAPRTQAWVDLLGTILFLLPTAGLLLWLSYDYAEKAWRLQEASRETGGLPFLYLLKAVIPVASGLLLLQGLADILQRALRLAGRPT